MVDNRYNHGKIYRLVNDVDKEEYIGSTCNPLCKRLWWHRSDAKKKPTSRVYEHMLKVGIEHFKIILVEQYPCENKMELLRRERYWIHELNPSLNHYFPSRSTTERSKEYYEINRDTILEKKKEYNEKHKDIIAGKMIKHYHKNKVEINARRRVHREANRDEINAKRRERYALKKQQSQS